MLVCFASDLHGDLRLYQQLEELLRAETPGLLILGGDLLPDGQRDDPLGTQVAYLERVFLPLIAAWRAAAPRLTVACIAGNHEWSCTYDALQPHHDAGRIVLLDHRRLWHHDGVAFLGYGCTPATPHWLKDFERLDLPDDPIPQFAGVLWDEAQRSVREADLRQHFGDSPSMMQELAQAPVAAPPWIFVAHAPPHDSKLDRLFKVPEPIGSRAVRRFIEERQPAVALHGHVHESPLVTGAFVDQIGATLCINPGQDHERLYAVLFDVARPRETLRHTALAGG